VGPGISLVTRRAVADTGAALPWQVLVNNEPLLKFKGRPPPPAPPPPPPPPPPPLPLLRAAASAYLHRRQARAREIASPRCGRTSSLFQTSTTRCVSRTWPTKRRCAACLRLTGVRACARLP
jgi:hypothetical protein